MLITPQIISVSYRAALAFFLFGLFGAGAINSVVAATVMVQINDSAGHAISDAVVYAEPAAGQALPAGRKTAEIEQKARKFMPLVTVAQTGTAISFPNKDTVRHHVYSFSPAKPFELKLYSGLPTTPLVFDKPGVIVLGCNIHDQMVAYIHIVDTPHFAKTDNVGKAKLDDLSTGKYTLKAWHYHQAGIAPTLMQEQSIIVKAGETAASFVINLKPPEAVVAPKTEYYND